MLVDITEQSKKEIDLIESHLNTSEITAVFNQHGAILAGGALTSVFTRAEINDFDIYFKHKEGFVNTIKEIFDDSDFDDSTELLGSHEILVCNMTDRSILTRDQSGMKIQLIAYKMFPEVKDIFGAFDYTINMCAYDFQTQRMYAHPDFLKHCAQRYLKFNTGTDYPIVSALRALKYQDRGYYISRVEMLRVLFTLANKQYPSWEVVKDEVGSMYGIPVDKLFDETKTFSLNEVVDQLDKVANIDLKFQLGPNVAEYYEVARKFPQWFPDNRVEDVLVLF